MVCLQAHQILKRPKTESKHTEVPFKIHLCNGPELCECVYLCVSYVIALSTVLSSVITLFFFSFGMFIVNVTIICTSSEVTVVTVIANFVLHILVVCDISQCLPFSSINTNMKNLTGITMETTWCFHFFVPKICSWSSIIMLKMRHLFPLIIFLLVHKFNFKGSKYTSYLGWIFVKQHPKLDFWSEKKIDIGKTLRYKEFCVFTEKCMYLKSKLFWDHSK